ncbi:hypothetical protein [Vulcanisaeta souniana]|uniref:Uncharacterized protein n=1 Tax=Vulcanisaeta souniana JCM 11219 TaxID=1293586 RepID=A0A830EA58_9CREN|nr:hypothetical protein [Vulcanisaeta souniana]BDR92218.1 hypothetical protein Vsou_13110 [Vulcanisaeta souniana JCM 11219]GGI85980.1 hypothetical protein GCM10007112_23680 [Vulcanisaeta souniana JCM 11219]
MSSVDYLFNWLISLFEKMLRNALDDVYNAFLQYLNIGLHWSNYISDVMRNNPQLITTEINQIVNLLLLARNDVETQYPLSVVRGTVFYRYEVLMSLLPRFLDLIIDAHTMVGNALRRLRLISIGVVAMLIIVVLFTPAVTIYVPPFAEIHMIIYIAYIVLLYVLASLLIYSLVYVIHVTVSVRRRLKELLNVMNEVGLL